MKPRSTLKDYFLKGRIPKASDFADLIDSMLIQDEDNILKLPNDPLSIKASGAEEALLNFYRVEQGENKPTWQLKQKPGNKLGLSIHEGSDSRLFIQSGTGNVGIGTAEPGYKLSVSDTIYSAKPLAPAQGKEAAITKRDAKLLLYDYTDLNWAGIGVDDGGDIWIRTGIASSNLLTIKDNGNVGIGTANSTNKLEIKTNSQYTGLLVSNSTHPVAVLCGSTPTNDEGGLHLYSAGVKKVQLLANSASFFNTGNIGIGTPTPSARLSVVAPGAPELAGSVRSATLLTSAGRLGSAKDSELALATIGFFSNNNTSLGIRALRTADVLVNQDGWNTTAIGLGMDVDDTVRAGASLWLHANGNVGIGTAEPKARVDVLGQGLFRSAPWAQAAAGIAGLTVGFDPANAGGTGFVFSHSTSGKSTRLWLDGNPILFCPAGSEKMRIDSAGNVGIGTTTAGKALHIGGKSSASFVNDGNDRPGLAITGDYPELDLFSGMNNVNHGPTIRLGAYNDDTKKTFKHWVIGTAGRNASFFDIGFSAANDPNPHAGIRNYNGTTVLTLLDSGNVGIGTTEPKNKLQLAGNLHMDGHSIFLRSDPTDQYDVIKWNSSVDRIDIGGYNGVNLGYTSSPGPNAITPVLTVTSGGVVVVKSGGSNGNLTVQGLLNGHNPDLAENYISATDLDPGDVVCLDPATDVVMASGQPNDGLVLGVVSTSPAFLLNSNCDQSAGKAFPIALCGRVPCKVVAENGPIKRGDLLTSASTVGHAMKAMPIMIDGAGFYRPGTIIGKALGALESGAGMIDIFVCLR
jgi:hypothetical protein